MLLVAAFSWLARIIAGNIGSLPAIGLSLSSVGGFTSGGSGGGASAPVSNLIPNLSGATPVQQGFLGVFVLVGVMLGYLLWRVRKIVPRENRTTSSLMTSFLVVLASFFLLLVVGRAVLELLVVLARQQENATSIISPELSTVVLTIGAGIAGLGLASLILYLLRRRMGFSAPMVDASYGTAREFANVIEGTVYSLRSGSDFRLAVLKCYKSLCDVLQDGGATNSPELTAREFEAAAVKKLEIGEVNIQRMTELFEKARYSKETVDEGDARDAEASLTSLVREVRARASAAGLGGGGL